MPEPIRIVIADDHPLFREGLHHTLARGKELEIVAEAADGQEALELTEKLLPDLILLDITMPKRGGIEIAKKISAIFPVIHIMMLTASENADDLMKALKAGARGYVVKGVSAKELINAIRTVAAGGTYISPELAGMLKRSGGTAGKETGGAAGTKLCAPEVSVGLVKRAQAPLGTLARPVPSSQPAKVEVIPDDMPKEPLALKLAARPWPMRS